MAASVMAETWGFTPMRSAISSMHSMVMRVESMSMTSRRKSARRRLAGTKAMSTRCAWAMACSSGVAATWLQRADGPRLESGERPNWFPMATMAASGKFVEWMTSSVMLLPRDCDPSPQAVMPFPRLPPVENRSRCPGRVGRGG
jgi:hypothetical protein